VWVSLFKDGSQDKHFSEGCLFGGPGTVCEKGAKNKDGNIEKVLPTFSPNQTSCIHCFNDSSSV